MSKLIQSLRWRFTLTSGLLFLVAYGISIGIALSLLKPSFEADAAAELRLQGQLFNAKAPLSRQPLFEQASHFSDELNTPFYVVEFDNMKVVQSNTNDIFSSKFPLALIKSFRDDIALSYQIIQEGEHLILLLRSKSAAGQARILAFYRTPDQVYGSYRKLRSWFLLLGLLGLGLLLVFSRVYANNLLFPIRRMLISSNKILANQMTVDRLPEIKRQDEIGELAKAFNEILDHLDRVNNDQKKFLADAAHELRTPLTILRGEIEVQMMKNPDDSFLLQSNLEEIDQLIDITNNLLLIARKDADRLKVSAAHFSLSELLDRLAFTFQKKAGKRKVMIIDEIEPYIQAFGDNQLIQRVLNNLIDNGIKYNKDGGTLRIHCSEHEQAITIEVEDTGLGIPEKDLPHIFNRFFRVYEQRTKLIEGTGLGLSIVKTILDEHGWELAVTSKVDEGTKFTITIPKEFV